MKLFLHFAVVGFSNCYLLAPEEGENAILIDPGIMNIDLLNLIERNGLYIRHILLTHNHNSHTAGIRTLSKIYDFDIYAAGTSTINGNTIPVEDGKKIELEDFDIHPILIEGHSPDSYIFKIRNMLFTGDTFSAGVLGSAPNLSARIQLLENLQKKIVPMEGNPLIFPGHGPPSTLEAELQFNPYFNSQKTLFKRTGF